MRMVVPALIGPKRSVAMNQKEYQPVVVVAANHPDFQAKTHGNSVIMAFEPTMADRVKIAAGENIYIALLTFGGPQQPIIVQAGPEEMSNIYGLELEV